MLGPARQLLATSCLLCVSEVARGDDLNFWVVLLLLHDELLLHGHVTVGGDHAQGVRTARRLDEVAHAGVERRAARQTVGRLELGCATDCSGGARRGELLLQLGCRCTAGLLEGFVAVCVLLLLGLVCALLLLCDVTHLQNPVSLSLQIDKASVTTSVSCMKIFAALLSQVSLVFFTSCTLIY